jgi:hypothetical protein
MLKSRNHPTELQAKPKTCRRVPPRDNDILLSKLIRRPLSLDAEIAPFFRPFWHHGQLLVWLTAGVIVQSFDLARVTLQGNIVEAANRQAPARVRCCNETSL